MFFNNIFISADQSPVLTNLTDNESSFRRLLNNSTVFNKLPSVDCYGYRKKGGGDRFNPNITKIAGLNDDDSTVHDAEGICLLITGGVTIAGIILLICVAYRAYRAYQNKSAQVTPDEERGEETAENNHRRNSYSEDNGHTYFPHANSSDNEMPYAEDYLVMDP